MSSLLKLYDKVTVKDYYLSIVESNTVGQKDQVKEYYYQMNLHHRNAFIDNIQSLTGTDQETIEILQILINKS